MNWRGGSDTAVVEMSRAGFTKAVKQVVSERSAFMCNNPDCRELTVEPHSDEDHSLKTGDCAHIAAASKGGARYDPAMTSEERNRAANAIWLCAVCHRRVDNDASTFTVAVLRRWKHNHEKYIQQKGVVPAIPALQLKTSNALSLLEQVTERDSQLYRECTLRATNQATVRITNLRLHLVLPEKADKRIVAYASAGTNARGERFAVTLPVEVTGPGIVAGGPTIEARNCLRFFVARLDPQQPLTCKWLIVGRARSANHTAGMVAENGKQILYHYLRGRFEYEHLNGSIPRTFWRALTYEPRSRSIDIGPPVDPDPEVTDVEIAQPRPSATGEYWGEFSAQSAT